MTPQVQSAAMAPPMRRGLAALLGAFALVSAMASVTLAAGETSAWVQGFNNKARLLSGGSANGKPDTLYVGLEISMLPDWKTYWRQPGDAGGVPPEFDWSGSKNLAAARVLFPAPHRLVDKSGTTIGYKDSVIFPVEITAKSPAEPVHLKLAVSYGVCKDICIPAEATFEMTVPADVKISDEISAAHALVPRSLPNSLTDPTLSRWTIDRSGTKPQITLEVDDPAPGATDAFVEAPDGLYLPLPVRVSTAAGRSIFSVDLTQGADEAVLKHKTLTVTLVGAKGQSETTIRIE